MPFPCPPSHGQPAAALHRPARKLRPSSSSPANPRCSNPARNCSPLRPITSPSISAANGSRCRRGTAPATWPAASPASRSPPPPAWSSPWNASAARRAALSARSRPPRGRRPRPPQRPAGVSRTFPALPAPPVPRMEPGRAQRRGQPGVQPLARLPARLPAPWTAWLGRHRLSARGRRLGAAGLRAHLAFLPARPRTPPHGGRVWRFTSPRATSAPPPCACSASTPPPPVSNFSPIPRKTSSPDPRDHGDTRLEQCTRAESARCLARHLPDGAHPAPRRPPACASAASNSPNWPEPIFSSEWPRRPARAPRRRNRTPGGRTGARSRRRPRSSALPPVPRSVARIAGPRANRNLTPPAATPSTDRCRPSPAANAASSTCWPWTIPAASPSWS
jgi:hypothetical protein